jgi:hypothetical protein
MAADVITGTDGAMWKNPAHPAIPARPELVEGRWRNPGEWCFDKLSTSGLDSGSRKLSAIRAQPDPVLQS